MSAPLPISPGLRFGILTTQKELPRRNGMRAWALRCDCGSVVEVLQKSFASPKGRRSCGCAGRQTNNHGMHLAPEYRHWINMISRCENPETPHYENYGGRGICICARWRESFANFYADMGPRPSPRHSVDRIDVDGNYEPGNCRWALPQTQARNTRSNHLVVLNGRSMTLAEAVEAAPVPYNTVLYRLRRGWRIEDAVRMPARKGHRPHA